MATSRNIPENFPGDKPPSLGAMIWYDKACYDIVRNGYNLFRWVNENNKGLTKADCEAVGKTKEFQAALRAERLKFYKELAADPERSRNTAVGQLLYVIQRLIDLEMFDKASIALANLFKVEGWNKEQGDTINVFQDLSSRDISALRAKIAKQDNSPKKLD